MKLKYYLVTLLFLGALSLSAQDKFGPTSSGTLEGPVYVPSIAEQIQNGTLKLAEDSSDKMGHPKGRHGNRVVPGKGFPKEGQIDEKLQEQQATELQRVQPPTLTFLSTTNTATPSDPTGAAGPNHYVAAWNTAFRIFDKNGNPLTPAASLATLFPGNAIGDPIVFYDAEADRFVVTEFDNNPNGFNVAVCQGSDPVNDGWHVYTTGFGTGAFPDYTKFSVFGDVYMVTANVNNGANGDRVFAVERNEMLNGDPAQFVGFPLPGISTFGFYSPQAFHTTDDQLAPAGTPVPIVYMQDDAWAGVSDDHLKIWNAEVDWSNIANSTISAAQEITTEDFIGVFDGGSFSNLPQPVGPDQDALQATIMNQAQYRRFGTYNSAVFNFVIDTDTGGGELAGIRWYELRQTADGQPWTIHQEGTYVSPVNNKNAFSGSMAMNSNGDIGMGYTTVTSTERVAIYYTGRFASDPLNVMTVSEELIFQSTGNNPSNRLADYTHLTVDPVDDSFWHVAEVFDPTRRDVVANFSLTPPQPDDIGVTEITTPVDGPLTAAEDVSVMIRNFGSNDVTDPEVQYTIDAGTPVVETYSGTIAAGEMVPYLFSTTADLSTAGQTYTIEARTNLPGDSNPTNDATTKDVTNGLIYCIPTATQGCNVDGIKKFVLNTIDADDGGSGCNTEPSGSPQGYSDRTDLSTQLSNESGSNVYTLQAQQNWSGGPGVEALSVWIDFDDNGTFDASEQLIAGEFFQEAGVLEDFTLTIPVGAALGSHVLRAKAIDTSADGDINNPCSDFAFGEVQDYTVVIEGVLSTPDPTISEGELIVTSLPNNQFEISLVTSFDGTASIAVYNMLGQTLAFNNLSKDGDRYVYDLDMSYVSSGVYLIKIGDEASKTYQSAKIVVK
ncbi:T9SS type A sorting domain-containing protein [Flavobacteriaceae bacterium TK19130]|nr:T9SS type A sorting domain-containing protein [Thermobacterium salinum]